MTDIYSKQKRSEIMSKISGKETKPEILVRKFLFANGFRYRKNDKKLPGKPDIVLPKYKIVIFVHGCFWHGHKGCSKAIKPSTNKDFWNTKIEKNRIRDKKVQETLKEIGWKVIVIWECQLRNQELLKQTLSKVINKIKMNE